MATKTATPTRGVLAHLIVTAADAILILDDVEEAGGTAAEWRVLRPYTEKNYPGKRLVKLELTSAEYEEIGFSLVNRLRVLHAPAAAAKGGETRKERRPQRPRKP